MSDPYFQYKLIKKQLKEIESVIRASLFIILVYYKDQIIRKGFLLKIAVICVFIYIYVL